MAGRTVPTKDTDAADTVTNASAEPDEDTGDSVVVDSAPKVNERGVVVNRWDNPDNDPNTRKHVGEDPHGKKNKLG